MINKKIKATQEYTFLENEFFIEGVSNNRQYKRNFCQFDAETFHRGYFISVSLIFSSLMVILIYFSYSSAYSENIYLYIVCLKILAMIFDYLFDNFVFSEGIMRCGLSCLIICCIFFSSLGAYTFFDFLFSFFVDIGSQIVERTYISLLQD